MNYQELTQRLTSVYDAGEARALVRMVFDIQFGMSLTDLLCGKIDELSDEEKQQIERIFNRLEQGEPVHWLDRC